MKEYIDSQEHWEDSINAENEMNEQREREEERAQAQYEEEQARAEQERQDAQIEAEQICAGIQAQIDSLYDRIEELKEAQYDIMKNL